MSGFTGKHGQAGVVHRGERLRPDGGGGIIHEYSDGELIYHYVTVAELLHGIENAEQA